MKKIEAIIRPEIISSVKTRLMEMKVGVTLVEVTGWSKERELHLQWRGQKIAYDLVPKMKLEIVVPDHMADEIVKSVLETARTEGGHVGDGVIFISTVEEAVNIATSLTGEKAIVQPG